MGNSREYPHNTLMNNPGKTRILYLGPLPPELGGEAAGGIATHAWELAVQAARHGFAPYFFGGRQDSFIKDGVRIIGRERGTKWSKAWKTIRFSKRVGRRRIKSISFLSFRERITVLYLAARLQHLLSSLHPDLIHLHSLLNPAGLSLTLLGLNCPLMVTNYELFLGSSQTGSLLIGRRILERISCMIHISRYTLDRARRLGVNYPKNEKVIYIPIHPERVTLLNRQQAKQELKLGAKKVVFFYGTYQPIKKKGLDLLLKAFADDDYLRRNCLLILRTAGEGLSYARRFLARESMDARILDWISWEKMVKYYNASDLFVMPSRSEGLGLVYLEALLAGTPVVGFPPTLSEIEDLAGIRVGEKFDAGRENCNELARKMREVLSSGWNREFLRDRISRAFRWEERFREYQQTYQEVLNDGA